MTKASHVRDFSILCRSSHSDRINRMNTICPAEEIEHRLLRISWDVCWSPQHRAFVASCVDYPNLSCAHATSSGAALDGLENMIRIALRKCS